MRRYFSGRVQILDSLGDPVPGAKLEFFEAGTSNLEDTFTDFDLTTANTNPIICDSGGWCTVFMTPNVFYDYTAKDADDVLLYPKVTNVVSYEPPLTTKGDIFTFDTDWQRLGVGADGLVLKADSAQATGLVWGTAGDDTLTTKGDLYTYDTDNARLAVGNDGDILVADSSEATGLKWRSVLKARAVQASNQSMTASTLVKINLATVEYDTKSGFSSGTFTVPTGEGGYYLLIGQVTVGVMGDNDPFDYMIKINSTYYTIFGLHTATNSTEIAYAGGAMIKSLSAGDTISLYGRIEDAGISAYAGSTWLDIYRLA